jgi:hypothetical protein
MAAPLLDFSTLDIHPLTDELEVERWSDFMRRYHPQGWRGMVGEQIRYVVVDERGRWVACLGWCAAAQRLSDRERWIGWTPAQQRQRLHLVANNTRFLILPEFEGCANLASRVLGMNARRLSADWQERYGHPIWLAETFVEQDRLGSCYRACGWLEVGETKGFRRTRAGGYRQHGIVKRYFVRPIIKRAVDRLSRRAPLAEDRPLPRLEPGAQPLLPGGDSDAPGLLQVIEEEITDCRQHGGQRYRLSTILGILILGILAGETTCAGIARWATGMPDHLRRKLGCILRSGGRRPVPTVNTFRYVLQDLEPGQLERLIRRWCEITGLNLARTTIAIDGKVLRGSATDETPARAQLNIYDTQRDLPLGQRAIPEKTSEVTAIRDLIEDYDITDRIVTIDAAHTNRATMTLLVEKGGSRFVRSKTTRLSFTSGSRTPSSRPA